MPDTLSGPDKLMAQKWGKGVVVDVGLFPIPGTPNTDCFRKE